MMVIEAGEERNSRCFFSIMHRKPSPEADCNGLIFIGGEDSKASTQWTRLIRKMIWGSGFFLPLFASVTDATIADIASLETYARRIEAVIITQKGGECLSRCPVCWAPLETLEHLFLECRVAVALWEGPGLGITQQNRFVCLLWRIWKSRNWALFDHVQYEGTVVLRQYNEQVREWLSSSMNGGRGDGIAGGDAKGWGGAFGDAVFCGWGCSKGILCIRRFRGGGCWWKCDVHERISLYGLTRSMVG
ncbi:unnamed protein product [Linum trigynum]|uniref:Reverse transcriptase zinc-binding domain-containing protein n=1 Tax=Linum trigynum TaxID=586398 RepID=A0AAV2FGJ7_9ROSI